MDSNTFAENIKKKYPEYANIDNATLTQKIVAKYPVYKDQISDYTEPTKEPGLSERIKGRIQERGQAFSEATSGTNGDNALVSGLKGAAQAFGGVADVGEEIIKSTPIGKKIVEKTQEIVGKGIDTAAEKLSTIPAIKEAAASGETGKLESALGGVAAAGEIAGTVAGAAETGIGAQNILNKAKSIASKASKLTAPTAAVSTPGIVSKTIKDITPKAADIRDRSIAKALRLAPIEDIATIERSTGNKIGEFMARHDLIKDTPEEITKSLVDFQRKNMNLKKDAVSLVDERFNFQDAPELETSIDFLMEDLSKRKSGEYVSAVKKLQEIKSRGDFDLMDAEFVRELFDDVESVYKRSGDVRDAISAQDKAQTIAPVRRFIEDRVSEVYPDINIRELNRNTQTSRAILDAIVKRSAKADTASNINLGDFAVLGIGSNINPITGAASLFGKKVFESSPVQLRIAKYFSGKAADITDGMTPKQLNDIQKIVSDELRKSLNDGNTAAVKEVKSIQETLKKIPIIKEKKLTPEIKDNIVNILDDYNLNKGKNKTLQEDAAKIAEDLGIKMPKTYGALVKQLEKLLID